MSQGVINAHTVSVLGHVPSSATVMAAAQAAHYCCVGVC
jgi:hypothetical protein